MVKRFLKKLAAAILIGTLAVTGTSAASVSANDGGIDSLGVTTQEISRTMYVVGEAGANVRSAPSTDYRILAHYATGACIQVNGRTSNDWYRITTTDPVYGGTTYGYISGGLLSSSYAPSGKVYTVSVNSFLSLRTGPSSDYMELGRLTSGSTVKVTGSSENGFVPVTVVSAASGSTGTLTSGYVYKSYLTSTSTRVVSVNSFLSLRNGPSSDYTELGRLTNGSVVSVTGSSQNGYVPVTVVRAASGSSGSLSSGYVYAGYLTSASTRTVSVNSFLSLRTGPSSSYTELGRLTSGSTVMVTGSSENGFVPVTVVSAASGSSGTLSSGYVYENYLS